MKERLNPLGSEPLGLRAPWAGAGEVLFSEGTLEGDPCLHPPGRTLTVTVPPLSLPGVTCSHAPPQAAERTGTGSQHVVECGDSPRQVKTPPRPPCSGGEGLTGHPVDFRRVGAQLFDSRKSPQGSPRRLEAASHGEGGTVALCLGLTPVSDGE